MSENLDRVASEPTHSGGSASAPPAVLAAPNGAEVVPAPAPRVPLFPDLFVSGLTGIVLMLCLYSLLCIFAPAALDVRANTATAPVGAKPAWYLLFLSGYIGEVPGWVVAVTPILLIAILVAWPFLDRNPSREPKKRIVALVFGALVAIALIALTYLGWVS